MSIATTILKQLGGTARISAMTGARNYLDHGDGVSFRFPNRAAGKPNYVQITLDPNDTYTVEFGRIRGLSTKTIARFETIYWDQLKEIFERETGLYLSL